MDISPHETPVGRQLVSLGAAATMSIATIVAAAAVIVSSLELASDTFDLTPFRGWQVNVTLAGIAVLIALLAVATIRSVVRTSRRLRDRTRHRRAIIMAAVLPGIWIGGLALFPLTAALSWAGRHTSNAATAQRQLDGMFLNSPTRPPLLPSGHQAADAATAAHLLHAADLGTGWWDADSPNPVELEAPAGAVRAARTVLAEQHRVSGEWHLDRMILERETEFRTATDARRYALDAQRQPLPPGSSPPTRASRALVGLQIWDATSTSGRTSRFVVGTTAFSVSTDPHSTDQASHDRILTRAITRATSAR